MVNGAPGVSGKRALLPVGEERVPKKEIVTILPQKMEETAVTLMDLLMKILKVVILQRALVCKSFSIEHQSVIYRDRKYSYVIF